MNSIIATINNLQAGTFFKLNTLPTFNNFSKGQKIRLGIDFSKLVKSGQIPGVIFITKDCYNQAIYQVI